jgi:hypothetical protein
VIHQAEQVFHSAELNFTFLGNRLNEYISHFEKLSYNTKHLHESHTRAKRAIGKDQHVHLNFSSHGEHFHLRLKRDLTTFSDNLEVSTPTFYNSIRNLLTRIILDSPL